MTNLNADEREDYFDPGSPNGDSPTDDSASFSYGALFDAPDFSSLVRGRRTPGAKEYETKVKSVLKSGVKATLRAQDLPDAATILHFGPGFAAAAGDLAAVSDSAKRAIDLITAPDNPWISFLMITLPFVAQLARNHEDEFRQLPEVRKAARQARKEQAAAADAKPRRNMVLHLPFGRVIRFRVGFRRNPFRHLARMIHVPTRAPADITQQVFSDPDLIRALERQGIHFVKMPS